MRGQCGVRRFAQRIRRIAGIFMIFLMDEQLPAFAKYPASITPQTWKQKWN